MKNELMEKLGGLQNQESFEQELAQVATPEDMQKLFAKHGVELTLDEVREVVNQASAQNKDELSAEDLDDVAGGAWWVPVAKFVVSTVASWLVKKGLDKIFG